MTDQVRPGDVTAAPPPAISFHEAVSGADTTTGSSKLSTIGNAIKDGFMHITDLFKADPKVEQGIEKCMDYRGRALGIDPSGQRKFCDGSTPMYTSGDSPVALPMDVAKR